MRSKNNPVIIIQARMGSTRLPGKSMMKIAGKPLIEWALEGAGAVKNVNSVVVAVTDKAEDNPLAEHVGKFGNGAVKVFRGASDDVLGRYYHAALEARADPVIRVCGDNPLIATDYMDEMIEEHLATNADITHNVSEIPLGAAGELINSRALAKMNSSAEKTHQREHVTPYAYEHPEKFRIRAVNAPEWMCGNFRMTIDEEDDLKMFEELFQAMKEDGLAINFQNALKTLRARPDIAAINASVKQKTL